MTGALRTRFTDLVGVRLPIVQTGMGWVAGARLAAATSEAGALGMIASATMSLEGLREAIARTSARTSNPFGVNLRPDMADLDERIALLHRSGIRIASFAGPPSGDNVRQLHDHGILVMPTVGAPRHAVKMAEIGVDAVIAQGAEGGGHTGSVPTTLLLPAVIGAVGDEIPVLGAGGFHSGQGLVAALAWGADGIAMGTRFLLTSDSRVPVPVKERYVSTSLFDTTVTKAIDGRPQRVIKTQLVERLQAARFLRMTAAVSAAVRFRATTGMSLRELVQQAASMHRDQGMPLSQVALAANAPMMTRKALVEGDLSAGILPTGQVVGTIEGIPSVSELLARISAEAELAMERVARGGR